MNRLIRKRVFHPTGLISLVILPIVFSWMVVHESRFHPKATLEFNLSPDTSWTWMKKIGYDIQLPRTGEWINFHLDSSAVNNDAELLRFEEAVRMFVSRRDTLKSICIVIGRGTRYSALVQIVDILHENGDVHWLYLPGQIWVPRYRPLVAVQQMQQMAICGGVHITTVPAQPGTWAESLAQSTIDPYRFLWSGTDQWRSLVLLSTLALMLAHSILKQTIRRKDRKAAT